MYITLSVIKQAHSVVVEPLSRRQTTPLPYSLCHAAGVTLRGASPWFRRRRATKGEEGAALPTRCSPRGVQESVRFLEDVEGSAGFRRRAKE